MGKNYNVWVGIKLHAESVKPDGLLNMLKLQIKQYKLVIEEESLRPLINLWETIKANEQ